MSFHRQKISCIPPFLAQQLCVAQKPPLAAISAASNGTPPISSQGVAGSTVDLTPKEPEATPVASPKVCAHDNSPIVDSCGCVQSQHEACLFTLCHMTCHKCRAPCKRRRLSLPLHPPEAILAGDLPWNILLCFFLGGAPSHTDCRMAWTLHFLV